MQRRQVSHGGADAQLNEAVETGASDILAGDGGVAFIRFQRDQLPPASARASQMVL